MGIDKIAVKTAIEAGKTALGIEFGSTRIKAVLVGKEAEAEVEADEADAADEAVEVSSEALLTESRLESSTLAIIRPTITTIIRAGSAQLQIFL